MGRERYCVFCLCKERKSALSTKRWIAVFALTILGALLFMSWLIPAQSGFWYQVDAGVFFYFNHLLGESVAFRYLVAFTNLRPFDAVAFLFMLGIFYQYYRRQDRAGKRWMVCIGLTMLVTAVIAKQFDMAMDFSRPSPTKFFSLQGVPVLRVSELTGWPAKDWSSMSFPGDHGMMLMIFSFFMLRYFGRKAFFWSALVVVVFSLPRIMAGAHWLTDVVVGAGSISCVVLSWMLLTPASDRVISWFNRHLPKKILG